VVHWLKISASAYLWVTLPQVTCRG